MNGQDIELATQGKVLTTGSRTSGTMAERLAQPSLDALHGGMGAIAPSDLVFAISKTGRSTELSELVRRPVERGVDVVADPDSPASRLSGDGGVTEDVVALCVTAGVESRVVGRALLAPSKGSAT